MKTANQLTFTTYEASLKLNRNDPIKIIFDNIDWSFIYSLARGKYSTQGAEGYDPVSLFKAQLLIYLGEVSSDRKLASALRYNARLCLLCGFNFLKTPSNGTFTNFRHRLGDDIFYESLHQLIAQAIALKVIQGDDTAIDSTHLWAYASRFGKKTCSCKGKHRCPRDYSDCDARRGYKNKHPEIPIDSSAMDAAYDNYENYRFAIEEIGAAPIIALNPRGRIDAITEGSLYLADDGSYTCVAGFKVVYWGKDKKRGRLKFRCPAALGKCQCLFRSTCSLSSYGRSFYLHPERNYRLIGPIPRGTDQWQEKYNARTSVERAYSEEKGSHCLANPRVRGLGNVKIHVYLALCAQVIKRIGATAVDRLAMPRTVPCMLRV